MIDINHHTSNNNICSIVLDYDFNNKFIIVAQKPNGNCLEGRDRKIYPMGYDKIYYWIIVHNQNALLGPYSEEEFLLQRKELKVPSNLKLDVNQ